MSHQTRVENQTITQTVVTRDWESEVTIGSFQADFPLCEADYLRLLNGSPKLLGAATLVFSGTVGFALSVLPKLLPVLGGKDSDMTKWEWFTLFGGLVLSIGLWAVGRFCLPNDRKMVMNRIDQHFKGAPRSRHIMKGQE
ncbi:hypothetical protein [Cupriavidus taiwanensis]|uniref:hypothetical protein n=1 Tax=Cupriavidus taiwanensis TaxID=164546 RepID=UPI0011C18202|nr:hypothetical protein [Cupriavidus taiwanensis]